MVEGVPCEYLGDLVAAVADDGHALLRDGDVLDVRKHVRAALAYLRQQKELIPVGGEQRRGLDLQPRVFQGALRVGLQVRTPL